MEEAGLADGTRSGPQSKPGVVRHTGASSASKSTRKLTIAAGLQRSAGTLGATALPAKPSDASGPTPGRCEGATDMLWYNRWILCLLAPRGACKICVENRVGSLQGYEACCACHGRPDAASPSFAEITVDAKDYGMAACTRAAIHASDLLQRFTKI